jgi:hypothetical protein
LSTPAALLGAGDPAVTVGSVADRAGWETLFGTLPAPHFTQSWVYGEGKRAEGWDVERLGFQQTDGTPVALCQVLVKRVLGIPVAARINRGPLFTGMPTPELQLSVFEALRARWRFARRGLLFIAPALPCVAESTALLRSAGFIERKSAGWGSALIDLTPTPDAIRAGVSSKWRNHLNGSLKAGIELRVRNDHEAFEWMIGQHADNMKSKGFVGPSPSFVRALTRASPQDFALFEGLIDGEPCSAILVVRHGIHAETFISWTGEQGRRTNAHHFLLWHVLMEAKRAGAGALDLGGYTTSDKYGAYKRGMKGREYRLAGEWLAL